MAASPTDDASGIEFLLLAVAPEGETPSGLAARLGRSPEQVAAAVSGLAQAGLVETSGDKVALTREGREAAEAVRRRESQFQPPAATSGAPTLDLSPVVRLIDDARSAAAGRAAREEAASDILLASDADRDTATRLLADAFAHGRLTRSEFEERTTAALSARTHGELDDVLHGLGGLQQPAQSHPARKAVFWVMTVLTSPFVLVGGMLLAFGSDLDDRIFGIVFLVLFLPGLLALRRWAWPRR